MFLYRALVKSGDGRLHGRAGEFGDDGEDMDGGEMVIGGPVDVQHVAHVTFDPFVGFLGLPDDMHGVPCRSPGKRQRAFGVMPEEMACVADLRGNVVPRMLLQLQHRLYQMGGLETEGIFRVAAGTAHEEELRQQLNEGHSPTSTDVHALAGIIKAWFRELPVGVLDTLPPDVVAAAESPQQMEALVSGLPRMQCALLEWVVELMADVADHKHSNKMNAHNIAMVFAPNMTQMIDGEMGRYWSIVWWSRRTQRSSPTLLEPLPVDA